MNLENIVIRGFRDEEWELLRTKRLEALKAHSNFFTRTYAEEKLFDEARWRNMINQTEGKIFGLFDGWKLIGLTGVFRNRSDDSGTSAVLGMSYIDSAYRGLGLSRLLYQTRIDWARSNGYQRAIVSHREGNEASRRANAVFGFKWTGVQESVFGDGSKALDQYYELQLK